MIEPSTPAQPEFIHPELDALEVYLASHPDVLKGLMDVPFGELLNQIADLGFDKDIIKEELSSTELFTSSIWLEPVGIESLEDFWCLSPLQYCEQWPDLGAALVAGVIKSIHVSDEQVALLSNAGGKTNLTKSEKWEIAGGAVLLGYVLPKAHTTIFMSRLRPKQEIAELASLERTNPDAIPFAEVGNGLEFRQKFSYSKVFGGTRLVTVEAKTLGGRIYYELMNTLPAKLFSLARIVYNRKYGGEAIRVNLETRSEFEMEQTTQRASTELLENPGIQEDINRNIVEAEIRPGREVKRVARFTSARLPENPMLDVNMLSDDVRSELNGLQKDLDQAIISDVDNSAKDSFIVVEGGGNRIENYERREFADIISQEELSFEDKLSLDSAQLESDAEAKATQDVDQFVDDAVSNLEDAVIAEIDSDVQVADSKAENIFSDSI